MISLDFLRLRDRRAQAHSQIICKMIAAHGDCRRVPQHSVAEDDQFRRSSADVEQAATELTLVLREARLRRSQRL
jgi:hypothetical protein